MSPLRDIYSFAFWQNGGFSALALLPNPHLGTTLKTPFPPLSFGKSFMKIRSAVPENGCLIFMHYRCGERRKRQTRMVQLPATAAIKYVAACCITRTRTITKTKTKTKTETRTKIRTRTKTKIGTITKIVPGCLCPFPPSSMLIRTV